MRVLHWQVFDCCLQKLLPHSDSECEQVEFNVLATRLRTDLEVPSSWHGGEHCMVSAVCHVTGKFRGLASSTVVTTAVAARSINFS